MTNISSSSLLEIARSTHLRWKRVPDVAQCTADVDGVRLVFWLDPDGYVELLARKLTSSGSVYGPALARVRSVADDTKSDLVKLWARVREEAVDWSDELPRTPSASSSRLAPGI